MNEALLAIYRQAHYRVRLPHGNTIPLRVDQPLAHALRNFVGLRHWSFLTAWNPRSQPITAHDNRHAQRCLRADLCQQSLLIGLFAGMASGVDGWREPSLFVIGVPHAAVDTLARKYQQNAYLFGHGPQPVTIRWLG